MSAPVRYYQYPDGSVRRFVERPAKGDPRPGWKRVPGHEVFGAREVQVVLAGSTWAGPDDLVIPAEERPAITLFGDGTVGSGTRVQVADWTPWLQLREEALGILEVSEYLRERQGDTAQVEEIASVIREDPWWTDSAEDTAKRLAAAGYRKAVAGGESDE